jgi:hypothetical protein
LEIIGGAVIRLSRDPTRRRWRRGYERHDGDGGLVIARRA